jgi:transposase
VAAPGGLRAAVTSACKRDGVAVKVVSAADLSRTHARCGYVNPSDDRYRSRPVLCDGCGMHYDQDLSATVLMIVRAFAPEEPQRGSRVAS